MAEIPMRVVEAAARGGLALSSAVLTPDGDMFVCIPSLQAHRTDGWMQLNHDPLPCDPHPDDGLCHACDDMVAQLGTMVLVACPDDPDYLDRAHDTYGHPVWMTHPENCDCEECDPPTYEQAMAEQEHRAMPENQPWWRP